jgi:hypothetical protein
MSFVVISQRKTYQIRYEKVGRLRPSGEGIVEVIRDGEGVIRSIRTVDIILALNGLPVPGLEMSESGNRMVISGTDGREYVVLEKQVRGMIRDWPKKKAALFEVVV